MLKKLIARLNKFWFDFKLYCSLCTAELSVNHESEPVSEPIRKSTIELIADTIDFVSSEGRNFTDLELEIYRSMQHDIEMAKYQKHVQSLVGGKQKVKQEFEYDDSLGYDLDIELIDDPNAIYVEEIPNTQRQFLIEKSMVLRPIDYISYHYIDEKRNYCGVILKVEMLSNEFAEITVRCHKNDRLLNILKNLGLPNIQPQKNDDIYYDDSPVVILKKPDGTIIINKDHKHQ